MSQNYKFSVLLSSAKLLLWGSGRKHMKYKNETILKEIQFLRSRLAEFRKSFGSPVNKKDLLYYNAASIACNLTELAIINERAILPEEEYWFGAGYHMSYDIVGEWSDIYTAYSTIANYVIRNYYFRF